MKFNLTTSIMPSLNVAAWLLGFFFVKLWTKFLDKSALLKYPSNHSSGEYYHPDLCRGSLRHLPFNDY
ncbi:putative metal-nicotianamine transporter YSL8 [Dendrobium catenatum]|uniref:Putative metal-nicotianamine transporter YSL8 n=1 Tax=Dendrobium catenatum TaxID=906689 RepID=A0A2I0XG18_9ASPA|nr:putative metal-nicotianamine transporter YSL8 [Dendrobium catenatum]